MLSLSFGQVILNMSIKSRTYNKEDVALINRENNLNDLSLYNRKAAR